MQHVNRIKFKAPLTPPTVEFDPSVMAWYVRFSDAKIAKTISQESPGRIYCIDLDSNGEVVGIELLGTKEFKIGAFRKIPGVDSSGVNFEEATFVPTEACEPAGT